MSFSYSGSVASYPDEDIGNKAILQNDFKIIIQGGSK